MGFSLITIFEIGQYIVQIVHKMACPKCPKTVGWPTRNRNPNPCDQCLEQKDHSMDGLKSIQQEHAAEAEEDIDLVERLT